MYNHQPQDYNCPFCKVATGGETSLNRRGDIVWEDDSLVAFISPEGWEKNSGNVLIISKEHTENIYDISDELLGQVSILAKRIAISMKNAYLCEGTSLRLHNEPAGNQEVWHFHMHVFPRWKDDNLYVNYENRRSVGEEERLGYATKLRDALNA